MIFFHLSTTWLSDLYMKFMFSKKATKIDEIFAVDLTLTTYCQIDGEDFVNFRGLLRKHELYTQKSDVLYGRSHSHLVALHAGAHDEKVYTG